MSTPAKKSRIDGKGKSYFIKQARQQRGSATIEPGDEGFLVTCNFKERDSIRECYYLLNEYSKKLTPQDQNRGEGEDDDDDDEITSQLQNQIAKTNKETKERAEKFSAISTGVQNLIFIKSAVDPLKLGVSIIRDLAETKKKRTKVTLRFIPIEAVCKAKMDDIKSACGLLFDKHFLKKPSTFGIIFNKRFHHTLEREEVIKELADLVTSKNIGNTVNLKDPQQSIIIEIIKNTCLITVLPDYFKLKKYNINELWEPKEGDKKDKETKADPEDKEDDLNADSEDKEDVANADPEDKEDEAKADLEEA